MDSPLRQIMEIGNKLVDEFMLTQQLRTKANPINSQYHLVFASVRCDGQVNACLYDFSKSSHPLLVFGQNTYEPRLKESDAEYWLPLVQEAYNKFQVVKDVDDIIAMASKGNSLSIRPVKPTPPPVRVIKNEKVISGKLSDK